MSHDVAQHLHSPDPPNAPWANTSPWAIPGIVDRLKELWGTNTSSRIANILSAEFGIHLTRAAVTGKLDRLGLLCKGPPRRNPEDQKAHKREREQQYNMARRAERAERLGIKVAPPSAPKTPTTPGIQSLNLTLAELPDNGCRFIAGNDYLYCGHPQRDGSSYCKFHHGIIWVKPLGRGRAAR